MDPDLASQVILHHRFPFWGPRSWELFNPLWHITLKNLLNCFRKRDNTFQLIVQSHPLLCTQLFMKHSTVYPFRILNINILFLLRTSYNWDQSWHWSFLKSWVSFISFFRNLNLKLYLKLLLARIYLSFLQSSVFSFIFVPLINNVVAFIAEGKGEKNYHLGRKWNILRHIKVF